MKLLNCTNMFNVKSQGLIYVWKYYFRQYSLSFYYNFSLIKKHSSWSSLSRFSEQLGCVKNVSKTVFFLPTSIFCCHFMCTYGIFSQKRVSKNFLLVENWPQNGAHPLNSENVTLSKHKHVGCLSWGNGLEFWHCTLRFLFWWAYLEK